MESLFNNVKSMALNVGEMLTPILTESKFLETGVLTPDEFVIAGDHLIHHCPTWTWSAPADPTKNKPYLPLDKQYLISRNVPCYRRCKDIEYDPSLEKILSETGEGDEAWVDTHHYSKEDHMKVTKIDKDIIKKLQEAQLEEGEEVFDDANDCSKKNENDIVGDINDEDDEIEDPNAYVPGADDSDDEDNGGGIIKTRTYDLNITYDKYYQVPRLWLMGYNENKQLLTVDEMNEDFSQDHQNKTITFETHPFSNLQMASIHPCRHAEVVKKICNQMQENGREIGVNLYIVIFLKFMAAVIPTIEYDFTQTIEM
uniref:Ubiquitin-like-conjugating enzyme ATG3 n=1 Tax=Parastrongyloides trichosuri TaxID=131310 RepID=A0A0N4ZIT1_PARTI